MSLQKHAPKHEFRTFPLFQRTHVTLNVGYACVSDLTATLGTSFIHNKHGGRKSGIPFTSKNMRSLHDKYAIFRHFKELQSNRMFFSAQLCKLPPQCWYFDWQFALSNLQPARTTCSRKLQICSCRFLGRFLFKLKISLGTLLS